MRGEGYLARHMESYDKNRLDEYIQTEKEREQENVPGRQEFVFGGVELNVSSHKSTLPEQLLRTFGSSESLELEDLSIARGTQSLRLSEIMEEPPTVFLATDSERATASHAGPAVSEDYPSGCVVINHLSSPIDILVLFHELGHNNIWQKSERGKRYRAQDIRSRLKNGEIDYRTAESILKSERDAWAFALKMLRPFFNNRADEGGMMSVSEARHFIHDLMLSSYTRKLERELSGPEKEEIEAGVGEVFEEAQLDGI